MSKHLGPWEKPVFTTVLEGCYADDGNPIKCYECGNGAFIEKMRDFIDFGVGAGPATEIEYFCEACGTSVAYWAYGSFDPVYMRANSILTSNTG